MGLSLCLALIFSFENYKKPSSQKTSTSIEIIKKSTSTTEQSDELKKLLVEVGPIKAQEDLLKSGLPFTGQTHLLIHVVGDYIYNTSGLKGLSLCKEYFLSACYHGFIINALAEFAMPGMVQAMAECNKAGPFVNSQCAHASGHGFNAWQDYDLVKASQMCDELGSKVDNFPSFNCYDGVFMENLWGVHDGAPSPKRWIKDSDPYYPCNDPRIPEKYLGGCWSNQASVMFQHFKGDLKKTAEGCDGVENKNHQEICYNNFSRQIHPMTGGKTDEAFKLCQNASGKRWQNFCLEILVGAAWSVGDRSDMPFAICARLEDSEKSSCYNKLYSLISAQVRYDKSDISIYCKNISDNNFKDKCLNLATGS